VPVGDAGVPSVRCAFEKSCGHERIQDGLAQRWLEAKKALKLFPLQYHPGHLDVFGPHAIQETLIEDVFLLTTWSRRGRACSCMARLRNLVSVDSLNRAQRIKIE
jgi:hypothetical protein